MSAERWFAARSRVAGCGFVRLLGQPEDGFADISGVTGWLSARGMITGRSPDAEHEGPWWEGWGDPYCAVIASRGDPWEPEIGVDP